MQAFVELVGAVCRKVGGARGFQATAGGCFGADTLEDAPGGGQAAGRGQCVLYLIGAGESAAVEEDAEPRVAREQVRGGFEHQGLAEIVLLGGVFEVCRRKEHTADFVFIEHGAVALCGERPGERAFTGSRKTGHKNEHADSAHSSVDVARF